MHEVDAVNEPQFEFVVRAGTVESTSSMPPSARRILAQLHWTTAAGTDDRVCLWAVDPTTSAEAGRVELESDTSDSLLNATAIEIGGSVFALSGELPKVVRAGYAILLVQAIARVRASTAKVDEPGGSAWRLHMRSG